MTAVRHTTASPLLPEDTAYPWDGPATDDALAVAARLWLETDQPEAWQERAVCKQTDPEAFFPEKGGSTREAKRICMGCEVRDDCLEYALDHREGFGIWGGLSERERRKLLRNS